MSISATLGLIGVAKKAGVVDRLKGINPFKRKEPNAGSKSLIDALDNYEKISTSLAASLEGEITKMLANGASDADIAVFLDERSYKKGGTHMMESWKWDILKKWLDDTRSLLQSQNYSSGTAENDGNPVKGSFSLRSINPLYLIGAAVIGWFAFRGKK